MGRGSCGTDFARGLFLDAFLIDFGRIFKCPTAPSNSSSEAILNDKTRGFCKRVQQKSRVLSSKNVVDKHFVETKSHPIPMRRKVSKTRGFCKVRSQNVQKPMGFLIFRVIAFEICEQNVKKPMGF